MFEFKGRLTKRNRSIALVLLGSSFAIQMVPQILHSWAKIIGVNDEVAMAVISIIYLLLFAFVIIKGRQTKP